MMKFPTVVARIFAVGALMALAGSAAAQQAYPSKPIRFIVPYPPGGSVDPLARLLTPKLTESLGQPVIVDNRAGGNTIIGSEALVKSPPDGYVIMLHGSALVINALLNPNLPYDLIRDFAPVATVASTAYVLTLNPSVPANTLQEFIELAKSKPGQLNFATVGDGGLTYLGSELFGITAGVKLQRIPYKGSAPALIDLVSGQIQLGFNTPIASITHIRSGRLKAVAVGGETRMLALPEVPTFAEAGLRGFNLKAWYMVLVPASTPKAITDKLSNEFAKIIAMSDVKEKLADQGMVPFISTPEQVAALIKAETAKYVRVIKIADIKIGN